MTEFEAWKAEQSQRWLNHLRDVKHDISRLEDEIAVARSLALPSGIDYTVPYVRSSPSADAIPNAVARLEGMIADYCVALDAYLDELQDARERVACLCDARHREVLTLYYLSGHSWATVSDKAGYSEIWCKQLRDEALPLVYDHIPPEWRTMIPRAD